MPELAASPENYQQPPGDDPSISGSCRSHTRPSHSSSFAYWKSRHRDALRRIAGSERKVEQLEGEKRQLKADLFGKSTQTTKRMLRRSQRGGGQERQPGRSVRGPTPSRGSFNAI
jgi:hypothetical protein